MKHEYIGESIFGGRVYSGDAVAEHSILPHAIAQLSVASAGVPTASTTIDPCTRALVVGTQRPGTAGFGSYGAMPWVPSTIFTGPWQRSRVIPWNQLVGMAMFTGSQSTDPPKFSGGKPRDMMFVTTTPRPYSKNSFQFAPFKAFMRSRVAMGARLYANVSDNEVRIAVQWEPSEGLSGWINAASLATPDGKRINWIEVTNQFSALSGFGASPDGLGAFGADAAAPTPAETAAILVAMAALNTCVGNDGTKCDCPAGSAGATALIAALKQISPAKLAVLQQQFAAVQPPPGTPACVKEQFAAAVTAAQQAQATPAGPADQAAPAPATTGSNTGLYILGGAAVLLGCAYLFSRKG